MKTRVFSLSAIALGTIAITANAQTTEVETSAVETAEAAGEAVEAVSETTTEVVEAVTETAEPAVVDEPAICELHVYPTTEGQAQNIGLFGPGIINQAINNDKNISNAEYMREALSPRFQVESFQSIDVADAVGMPEGTEVIYQTPIADRDITTKVKTRLSDSTHACYAELIVTQNLYQKKMIYGRSLNNRFIFKDFRNGVEEARLIKGRGGNGLSEFPPKNPEDRPAANADLRQAFLANFHEYAKRFK